MFISYHTRSNTLMIKEPTAYGQMIMMLSYNMCEVDGSEMFCEIRKLSL